eukprot:evm.model.scf_202.1 EVM.evm.TU.scf_202.1   scf_202:7524-10405(-)
MAATSITQRASAFPARAVGLGSKGCLPARPASGTSTRAPRGVGRKTGERLVVRAEEGGDFDELLMKLADKFEKVENKPLVIGYGVGSLVAFLLVEWLIHLPILDILLGFPAQLLGVLLGPVLLIRYLVDKEDISTDIEQTVAKITSLLPGSK